MSDEWLLAQKGVWVDTGQTRTLRFMSEDTVRVYFSELATEETERLLTIGEGEVQVRLPRQGFYRLESDGRAWTKPVGRPQERKAVSTEVFTTLDRPAPLSPEMAALMRLERQNTLERERMYAKFEQRLAAQAESIAKGKSHARDTSQSATVGNDSKELGKGSKVKKKAVSGDAKAGGKDTADANGDEKDAVSEPASSGD